MPLFSLYPQNKAKNNNNDYVQLEYSSTLLAPFLAGMAWAELSSIHLQSVIQLANEERERTNSFSRFVPPRASHLCSYGASAIPSHFIVLFRALQHQQFAK